MARRFKTRTYKLRGRWKAQPGADVQAAGSYVDRLMTEAGGKVPVSSLMPLVDDPDNPLYTVVEHDAEVGLRKYQRQQLAQFMSSLVRVNVFTDGSTEELDVFQAVIVDDQHVPIVDADDVDAEEAKRLGSVTKRDFFIDHTLVHDKMAQVALYNETVRNIEWLQRRLDKIEEYSDPGLAKALDATKRRIQVEIRRLRGN